MIEPSPRGSKPRTPGPSLGRRRIVRFEIAGVPTSFDADRVTLTLRQWVTSPYWIGGHDERTGSPAPGERRSCRSASSDGDRTALVDGPLARHLRVLGSVPTLTRRSSPARALVDHWHLGRAGVLSLDDYRAFAEALTCPSPDAATFTLDDGTEVEGSVAGLTSALVAEGIRAAVPERARRSTLGLLSSERGSTGPARGISIAALLPIPVGLAERSLLCTAPSVAVPLALFPLTTTLLPEIGPVTLPTTREPSRSLNAFPFPPMRSTLITASRAARLRTRLELTDSFPAIAASVVPRMAATVVRRSRSIVLRVPGLARIRARGLDLGGLGEFARRLDRQGIDGSLTRSEDRDLLEENLRFGPPGSPGR